MRYINEKTGAVVDSSSVIQGKDWKPVEEKQPEKKPVTKKTTSKPKE